MTASEYHDWVVHLQTLSPIDQVKELLKREEAEVFPCSDRKGPINILHNKDKIYLQYCGWSINLYADGTWGWEDTTGG